MILLQGMSIYSSDSVNIRVLHQIEMVKKDFSLKLVMAIRRRGGSGV
jgi:hypothetical protein